MLALIHIKPEQREIEQEEEVVSEITKENGEKGEDRQIQTIIKKIDEDGQGKALAVLGQGFLPCKKGENMFNINHYASKLYRENFLEYIEEKFPEFFDDNKHKEEI